MASSNLRILASFLVQLCPVLVLWWSHTAAASGDQELQVHREDIGPHGIAELVGSSNDTLEATENQTLGTRTNPPNSACDCGWNKKAPQTRIVGGPNIGQNEFPSFAVFVKRRPTNPTPTAPTKKSIGVVCGATIISTKAALTAAQCVEKMKYPSKYALVIGGHGLNNDAEQNDLTQGQFIMIAQFILHPDFNYANTEHINNIALAILQTPITLKDTVGPACLPFAFENVGIGQRLTAVGWGKGKDGVVFQKVVLEITEHKSCSNSAGSNQVCVSGKGRKGPCGTRNDLGGPLYASNRDGKQFLIAVINDVSSACKSRSSIHARVHSYIDWIQSNLPGDNFCVKDDSKQPTSG